MADEDDDKIVDTKLIKEARKEYEEYAAAVDKFYKTAEEREDARLRQLEAQRKYADESIEKLERDLDTLMEKARLETGFRKQLTEEQIDGLQKLHEIKRRLDTTGNEEELESYKNLMDQKIEQNDRFANALNRVKDGMRDGFNQIDSAALQAMGSALGLINLFGAEVPSFKELFSDFAVSLDDARRSIVPFTRNISEANSLQDRFGTLAGELKIPITELGENVGSAAGQFRMFAMQEREAQAALVGFHSQMKNMGVDSGSSIIESIMSDSGVSSAGDAIDIFKALTVQMKDLGVMPQTLAADYNKLIGTFAMFGDAAGMNIAKVSFQAQKAKVDTGAITGFADNFKGYSDAGRTAQTINAIFGRKIIDNPAELVSVFYTGGPAAALELVKRKIVSSGIDIEEMLGGAAGAARLQMLAQLGFGSAQAAKRLLTTDTTISPGDQAALDEAATGGPADKSLQNRFNALAEEMLTQSDRLKQLNEEITFKFFDRLGIGLGQFGEMFNGMIESVRKGFFDKDGLLDQFEKGAEIKIPGLGGTDPVTGELIDSSTKELLKKLIPDATGGTPVTKAREPTRAETDFAELDRKGDKLSPADMEKLGEIMAASIRTAAVEDAATIRRLDTPPPSSPGETKITLVVGGKEMDAYLRPAIERFSRGA